MPFDVFALREKVVSEYRDYVESFVNILDERIEEFVRDRLREGELWPDAVLQLNPAYEEGARLTELAHRGVIARETARFFGDNLLLYRHQEEALAIAQRGEPYVVSTGTGSGKSLTYLLPIVDHVFRHEPAEPRVRALIVYPMNALINSQLEALERYRRDNWPDCPLRFARYTGQEKDEQREEIINNPPHILLTNYVMLEYLLVRSYERTLVDQMTRALRFLVLDELHVYRGRQGADVAMLVRRVRERAKQHLQIIGTSATIATGGGRDERRQRIADVGSTLFGVPIAPANVIDETLRRVAAVPVPRPGTEVRKAVELPPPEPDYEAVRQHPLTAWVEEAFGLEVEDGRLVRRPPVTFAEGLKRLGDESGLPEALCQERLKATLEAGNQARLPTTGEPVFAFRLHQFLASGSSVFATLEDPSKRDLTTDGQYALPARGQGNGAASRVLFPLAFCRDCGQEYYLVSRLDEGSVPKLIPRSPLLDALGDDTPGTPGFLVLDPLSPRPSLGEGAGVGTGDGLEERANNGLWSGAIEELPEFWLEERRGELRPKGQYAPHVPVEVWVRPDGTLVTEESEDAMRGWFQPRPLMLCLRCRAAYDLRDKRDFRKLATLSQTGRSTATTIITNAAISGLREMNPDDPSANKLLSFTDNRQDASLQAGHLNDFAQVALFRGALVRALAAEGPLTFSRIGAAIFTALDPRPEDFLKDSVRHGPGYQRARDVMVDLLTYRAFEDLRRGWHVAQPNLEQVGLLRISYDGLDDLAKDEALWSGSPVLAAIGPQRRRSVLVALLNHLRSLLAIDAECLTESRIRELTDRANAALCQPWSIDRTERLRQSIMVRLPDIPASPDEKDQTVGSSARSLIGRYLRSRHTWGFERGGDLSVHETEQIVQTIVAALRGHLLTVVKRNGQDFGFQLRADALRWEPGDGRPAGLDPIRVRAVHQRRTDLLSQKPNAYFWRLYQAPARLLAGIVGAEHTGQVAAEDRLERERKFRAGSLPALFCSPTMELGVDIADLHVVHLRNIPPTPANYAQRSGRAGRGGRPALVVAFASEGNAHDTYFFRRRDRMIAGAVAPARMDLGNRELVQAHLQAVWLAATGVSLGKSIADVLDLDDQRFPIQPEKWAQLQLSDARQKDVIAAFREITAADPAITGADWFTDAWLEQTVRDAPVVFNNAFNRWRELYRAAVAQRSAAREKIDRPRLPREERQAAEQREREAKREIDLLLNQGDITESDFYPYRYLGTEGFLPGYNFPALPLRVLVNVRDEARVIDRPRFLGLAEFGPWNIIYHEGRKHRVTACVLPSGGLEPRISRAKLCKRCGYVHPDADGPVDICEGCGTLLDGTNLEYPQALLEQTTVRARQYDRISSDEEERAREGYRITTHFRFAPNVPTRRAVAVSTAGEVPLLEVEYAPRAELWQINHGWRRVAHQNGFTLDPETGRWQPRDDDELDDNTGEEPGGRLRKTGIKPYVTDNLNLLLLRPVALQAGDASFLNSLAVALQRGIQVVYQVEESELAVDLIGEEDKRRLLLWETAEGGTGVWERMIADPQAFSEVAAAALEICHYDEAGNPDPNWARRCTVACYDCLLSYSNQRIHRSLDRHLIKDYLVALARSTLVASTTGRSYDEHYRWLLDRTDPASPLERDFLDYLHAHKLRLPDLAQHRPSPDLPIQTDFFYHREGLKGVCVFIDGPAHDTAAQAERDCTLRDALADEGFRVITIRYDQPFEDQIRKYPEVFGSDA